jgi:hypothetical protein
MIQSKIILLILLFTSQSVLCQFGPRQIIDTNVTNGITEIITVDINNDNLKDVIVSQKYTLNNKISYYLNQGSGSFGTQQILGANIALPPSLASGDFNNDGWVDIVTMSQQDDELILFANNNGTFPAEQIIDNAIFHPVDVKVTDIDNDNDDDIVAIGDTNLIVYYNDGSGIFTKTSIPQGISTEYYDLAISDIDGDGFDDIIVGAVKTLVYKNINGIINFDLQRTNSINEPNLVTLVNLNDFDNDGDIDLIIGGQNQTDLRWYSNNGNGFFSLEQIIENDAINCMSVSLNDFDNDGDIDLFTTFPQSGKVVWYENDGSGVFGSQNLIHQGTIPFTNKVFSDDLNNDGLMDIIWSRELSIHLNNTLLSVNEFDSNINFEIYPNPASNRINIKSNFDGKLSIYNNLGQLIYRDLIVLQGNNTFKLNLSPQSYILILEKNKTYTHKKMIIH